MKQRATTTIAVSITNHDRLKKHGNKGDSFNTVLTKLLDSYENNKEKMQKR